MQNMRNANKMKMNKSHNQAQRSASLPNSGAMTTSYTLVIKVKTWSLKASKNYYSRIIVKLKREELTRAKPNFTPSYQET